MIVCAFASAADTMEVDDTDDKTYKYPLNALKSHNDNMLDKTQGLTIIPHASSADLINIYHQMGNGKKIIMISKYDECLNTIKYCKGMNIVIIYTGLCKTKLALSELMINNIDKVVVHNEREIPMLESMGIKYLLKIKLNFWDIGIHNSNIKTIATKQMHNFYGIVITLSKKIIIKNMVQRTRGTVDEYSNAVYREMSGIVTSIIDTFLVHGYRLKLLIIDVKDIMDQDANCNQSNVAFKVSMYNYILNAGINDCTVA